ncbi:MAG: hypothetical protein B5M53_11905 [Candidatus Cloacimonas sp. 4484_209]|nr:MAG: hypothetical protein B5M53_11905 [Candidatus Cloacimonas sp. 4484_209]
MLKKMIKKQALSPLRVRLLRWFQVKMENGRLNLSFLLLKKVLIKPNVPRENMKNLKFRD